VTAIDFLAAGSQPKKIDSDFESYHEGEMTMRVRTYNDVIRDFVNMADAMNRAIDRNAYDYAGNGGSAIEGGERVSRLPLDVMATPEAFHVSAYVPGIDPEAVEITFEGDELTIRGQLPTAEENGDWLTRELYHGGFERRLTFNVPVNADAIEAHFHNGFLTLHVPKAEAVRPKQIKIQAK
jgi:HSP20 family protein